MPVGIDGVGIGDECVATPSSAPCPPRPWSSLGDALAVDDEDDVDGDVDMDMDVDVDSSPAGEDGVTTDESSADRPSGAAA